MKKKQQRKVMKWLQYFSKGLELLDDYDHERVDHKGLSQQKTIFPEIAEYYRLGKKLLATLNYDFKRLKANDIADDLRAGDC